MTCTTASESEIQRAILDYLAARHIFAIRVNSGTTLASYKGKTRAIHMAAPGTADILAFPHIADGTDWHQPLWLEVKSAAGKQSDLQKSFQTQVENEGHRYCVVRSLQDVEEALR